MTEEEMKALIKEACEAKEAAQRAMALARRAKQEAEEARSDIKWAAFDARMDKLEERHREHLNRPPLY